MPRELARTPLCAHTQRLPTKLRAAGDRQGEEGDEGDVGDGAMPKDRPAPAFCDAFPFCDAFFAVRM